MDLSLQANRTSGLTVQLLMKKFEVMATYMREQLDLVLKLFDDSTQSLSNPEQSVRNSKAAIGFLKKLTPHAIGAAKSLEGMHI